MFALKANYLKKGFEIIFDVPLDQKLVREYDELNELVRDVDGLPDSEVIYDKNTIKGFCFSYRDWETLLAKNIDEDKAENQINGFRRFFKFVLGNNNQE